MITWLGGRGLMRRDFLTGGEISKQDGLGSDHYHSYQDHDHDDVEVQSGQKVLSQGDIWTNNHKSSFLSDLCKNRPSSLILVSVQISATFPRLPQISNILKWCNSKTIISIPPPKSSFVFNFLVLGWTDWLTKCSGQLDCLNWSDSQIGRNGWTLRLGELVGLEVWTEK